MPQIVEAESVEGAFHVFGVRLALLQPSERRQSAASADGVEICQRQANIY
jgi:tRNA threonylcarbamoyladenosine modification (KEOPS) complex Cgi121 subunit